MLEEKRRNPRVQDKWPVTIQASKKTMTCEMKDLTSGGAFLDCEKPLAPGEIFDMSIHIQDRVESLTAKAQVVWSSSRGMGVRFLSQHDWINPSKE
jgi:Tfp pilus assembly protein PilZ